MKCLQLLFLLVLCSCSDVLTITTKAISLPDSQAPEIMPLNLKKFNWRVYNDDQLKKALRSLPPGKHIVLYTLDNTNFKILDTDILELQRYIEEQNQVIIFYKQLQRNQLSNEK